MRMLLGKLVPILVMAALPAAAFAAEKVWAVCAACTGCCCPLCGC